MSDDPSLATAAESLPDNSKLATAETIKLSGSTDTTTAPRDVRFVVTRQLRGDIDLRYSPKAIRPEHKDTSL